MKIRNGFVSNSSSSSFTAIMKRATYDEMMSSLGVEANVYMDQHTLETGFDDLVLFTFMSGEWSDLDGVDLYGIAKEMIAEGSDAFDHISDKISAVDDDSCSGVPVHDWELKSDIRKCLDEAIQSIEDAANKLCVQDKAMITGMDF